MLNNSYKKIFIICCLFMNNSIYSMEGNMEFRFTTRNSQLKNSISDINQINDSSKDRQIEKLSKQVNDLYDMNEVNHEQIKQLQKQVKDLFILLNNNNKKLSIQQFIKLTFTNKINSKQIEQNKQIEELQKQVNNLSTKVNNSNNNKQIEELQKQINDLSTKVNNSNNNKQIEELQKQVNNLSTKVNNSNNNKQIEELQKQVNNLSTKVNNSNNNKQIEELQKQINDLSSQVNNISNNKQIEELSKQVNDLSTQVENSNQKLYHSNQKNEFIDILQNTLYLFNNLESYRLDDNFNNYYSLKNNLNINKARSSIVSLFLEKKSKNYYGISISLSQYCFHERRNGIIKDLIDKKLIIESNYNSNHNGSLYEISREITDIDYFKYFNEINSIELNDYYVILKNLKDNLILLHKYIPLQEFKHSSFPNNLQFMIDEISKQPNDLQIIKGEYKELETQVLNL